MLSFAIQEVFSAFEQLCSLFIVYSTYQNHKVIILNIWYKKLLMGICLSFRLITFRLIILIIWLFLKDQWFVSHRLPKSNTNNYVMFTWWRTHRMNCFAMLRLLLGMKVLVSSSHEYWVSRAMRDTTSKISGSNGAARAEIFSEMFPEMFSESNSV